MNRTSLPDTLPYPPLSIATPAKLPNLTFLVYHDILLFMLVSARFRLFNVLSIVFHISPTALTISVLKMLDTQRSL